MDRKIDGGFGRVRNSSVGGTNSKRSYEGARVLRKKKSTSGIRNTPVPGSPTPSGLLNGNSNEGVNSSGGGLGEGGKARKGSIRDAVKRFWGRRSRDVGTTAEHPSPSGHSHASSVPWIPPAQPEIPETYPQHTEPAQPTLTEPQQSPTSPPFSSRIASPSLALFPKSAQLQPLDLGNPFQRKELRRRKTLPSVVAAERESAVVEPEAALPSSSTAKSQPGGEASTREGRDTASSIRRGKRLSRSTDDLRNWQSMFGTPVRKRSDEIRYWQEHLQADTPRAAVVTQGGTGEEHGEDNTPVARPDPFEGMAAVPVDTMPSSPPTHRRILSASSGGGMQSPVPTDTELEDRVAKLEARLQNFQSSFGRQLQKLTADRNRGTVIMGGVSPRRSSGDMRTPSMLADTLTDPLDPSSYRYEYGHTMRPVTSPPPFRPQTPEQHDSYTSELPQRARVPSRTMQQSNEPPQALLGTPSPPPLSPSALSQVRPRTARPVRNEPESPESYSARALYRMLLEERSARAKIENQLHRLRTEILDLHTQVNSPNIASPRSSYVPRDSMMGTSRLADILRDTEDSRPGTSLGQHPERGLTPSAAPVVQSRFSGSESETAGTEYEDATPAFETPAEEHRYLGGEHSAARVEGMF